MKVKMKIEQQQQWMVYSAGAAFKQIGSAKSLFGVDLVKVNTVITIDSMW